ncbi:MAG: DNA/RNA nuclease SfsA [Lachnospiraceae bacterium]|nr:DNA/RNA nuclease SfsA [Lachnospiraceae bacterium]
MKYENIVEGRFILRPNRFIAHVDIGGVTEVVHVKNTGRCRELLLPGVRVFLERSSNPLRKTAYDLIGVYKEGLGYVNIDSQAPNKVMEEWLKSQDYDVVKPEYTFGKSRIDFYLEKGEERILCEVKGCTLEVDGTGYFPDAPTKRGVKHLHELRDAVSKGYRCAIAFVIAMENVQTVRANVSTDPEFSRALKEAVDAGVEVWFMPCYVTDDELIITDHITASPQMFDN